MATAPSKARLHQLLRLSCQVFETVYNPSAVRNGNKVLRKQLAGPALAGYYPTRPPNARFRNVRTAFESFEFFDEDEEHRFEMLDVKRRRGKGQKKKSSKKK
ncbi:mitochondrial ribosomal subunit S27-domain-containing protein [Lipomyces japonicus]|uniref:mitochondrial 37S ribosomal protein mS33 n=1 Tax=Lipomyces japonicus TaxID=56871 RepID=UPI0034CF4CBA